MNPMKFGQGGWAKGTIRLIEPNTYGGISVRIGVNESRGGSHLVFIDLYGRDMEQFQKEGHVVGDSGIMTWEIVRKAKLNKETGKNDGYREYKNNVEFIPDASNSGRQSAPKQNANSAAPNKGNAPAAGSAAAPSQATEEDDTW